MFLKKSLSKGATAASVIILGSMIGMSVAKTVTEIVTNMVAFVLGVVFWLIVSVVFASIIAYGRYRNDQQQFRKEVGFSE
jgi:phosphate/sulfate permease